MHDVGVERVAVVGCIGAGKSTVARALGEILGVEVFHLDRLWWQPSEYKITGAASVAAHTMAEDEFLQLEKRLAAGEAWVIDSGVANIGIRLARADTVVFLDLQRWICAWRVIKRHNRPRPDYPEGVREGFGWMWLLLRWIRKTWPTERRPSVLSAIEEYGAGATVVHLRTRREVRSFLDGLGQGETAPDHLR
jgi:adenylate kinase family enzyme